MVPAEAVAGDVILGSSRSIVAESGWFCLPGVGDR